MFLRNAFSSNPTFFSQDVQIYSLSVNSITRKDKFTGLHMTHIWLTYMTCVWLVSTFTKVVGRYPEIFLWLVYDLHMTCVWLGMTFIEHFQFFTHHKYDLRMTYSLWLTYDLCMICIWLDCHIWLAYDWLQNDLLMTYTELLSNDDRYENISSYVCVD